MSTLLSRLITEHPIEIGETYREHAGHALHIASRMIFCGAACLVHALVPGLFGRTASNAVEDIQSLMEERSSKAASPFPLPRPPRLPHPEPKSSRAWPALHLSHFNRPAGGVE